MIYYFLNSSFDVICWATKSFIIPYLAEYECKNEYDSYWAEIVCTSHEQTSHHLYLHRFLPSRKYKRNFTQKTCSFTIIGRVE